MLLPLAFRGVQVLVEEIDEFLSVQDISNNVEVDTLLTGNSAGDDFEII